MYKARNAIANSLETAHESGDHRAVMKYWIAAKQCDKAPSCPLSHIVESMQCCKKDTIFITNELRCYFQNHPKECNMSSMNDLLESLSRRLDSELTDRLEQVLPSLGLKKDGRTYEIF